MSVEMKTYSLADEVETASQAEGLFQISLEEGDMEAYLITAPPRNGMLRIDSDHIRTLMDMYGIVYGIEEGFMLNIPQGRPGRTRIAHGRQPVKGEDASVRRLFEESHSEEKMDRGSKDMRCVHSFIHVKAGETLVEKIPAARGMDGITVKGHAIPAAAGRDILLSPGENTMLAANGLSLIAAGDGIVRHDGDHVDVIQLFEIAGDVDYSVGHIDFEGSVLIRGNVLPGFRITATDSVEVRGSVDRATIEAGGDVRIRQGVYGGDGAYIKTCGSLYVRSLENADVRVIHDLYVGQYTINSSVIAGGGVYVQDTSRGRITGGKIVSGGDVETCFLGSSANVITVIDVGSEVEVAMNKNHYFNTMNFYNGNLEKMNQAMSRLRARHGVKSLNEKELQVLYYLENKARRYRENIRTLLRSQSEFSLKKKETRDGEVRITGTGFCGVQINSSDEQFVIKDDIMKAVVRDKFGGLAIESID